MVPPQSNAQIPRRLKELDGTVLEPPFFPVNQRAVVVYHALVRVAPKLVDARFVDHFHGPKDVDLAHARRGAIHDPVVAVLEEEVKVVGVGAVSGTARLPVGPRHLQPDEHIVVVVVQEKGTGIGAMGNHLCVYFFFKKEKGEANVGLDVLKENRNERLLRESKEKRKKEKKEAQRKQ